MDIATIRSKLRRSEATGCLLWTGARHPRGYGIVRLTGDAAWLIEELGLRSNIARAHRVIYRLDKGPLDPEIPLDHACRNTPCCDVRHLDPMGLHEHQVKSALERWQPRVFPEAAPAWGPF